MENAAETPAVSENWKSKFQMLEKIGADEHFIYKAMSSPECKALKPLDKLKISFNILAFIFGPFYYFAKKMWLKGAVLLGGIVAFNGLLTIIEIASGMTLPAVIYQIPGAVICAQLANYDFYRKMVHDENMWSGLSVFSKVVPAAGFVAASFIFLFSTLYFTVQSIPECSDNSVTNLVAQIEREQLAKQFSEDKLKNFVFLVNEVRTIGINNNNGSYKCEGKLHIVSEEANTQKEFPIVYTVESIDGGKNFLVNVIEE